MDPQRAVRKPQSHQSWPLVNVCCYGVAYLLTLTVTSVEQRTTTSRDYDSSQSGTAAAMSGNTVTFVNIHRVLLIHQSSKSIIIYAEVEPLSRTFFIADGIEEAEGRCRRDVL